MYGLNLWLIRINMVVWGLVIILFLKGCAAQGAEKTATGSLLCFGYCDLQIANKDSKVTVEPDGTEIEEVTYHGIGDHMPNANKAERVKEEPK